MATQAVLKEIKDLCEMGVFEVVKAEDCNTVPVGQDHKVIGSRMVLKVKYKADGSYDKHKGRMVVLGYQERPGWEFHSTFSPMATITTVRMMLSRAVHQNWEILQADIPNAFCQSKVDTEILLKFPRGIYANVPEGHFIRLLRNLYGTKQSGQLFHKLILAVLVNELHFKQAHSDSCLFYYKNDNTGKQLLLCSEVDDLVITGDDTDKLTELKDMLDSRFGKINPVTWSPLTSFMGVDIKYDRKERVCSLGVPYKIQKIFDDHPFLQLGEGKANVTPSSSVEDKMAADKVTSKFQSMYGHCCDSRVQFDCDDTAYANRADGSGFHESSYANQTSIQADRKIDAYLKENYRSIVGSLIYIMLTCRPDICFAVGKLSRHMHNPDTVHCLWLKRILRYLKRTQHDRLVYSAGVNSRNGTHGTPSIGKHFRKINENSQPFEVLCGFTDANHANAREAERKSITGFCFFLYGNCVMWKSKVQPLTAQSTHEAELIALSFCSDEAVWMRNVLQEIGIDAKDPTPILCDNQGTVFTVHNPYINHRSKHLDIRYYRTRQMIQNGQIDVMFCRTQFNLADFFTKSLEPSHFHSFKDIIMNTTPEMREAWREDGIQRKRERDRESNEWRRSRNRALTPPEA